jgi:hypothetical protein
MEIRVPFCSFAELEFILSIIVFIEGIRWFVIFCQYLEHRLSRSHMVVWIRGCIEWKVPFTFYWLPRLPCRFLESDRSWKALRCTRKYKSFTSLTFLVEHEFMQNPTICRVVFIWGHILRVILSFCQSQSFKHYHETK